MSNVTRPRGPLPSRVYWVRRLLVLGVALLLVLGIGRLLGGSSDGSTTGDRAETVSGEPTTSASTPSYGPTAPAAPTTSGKGRRGGKGTATPQAIPSSALPQPTGVCADDDVVVTPVPGTPAGGADVVVRLDFTTRTSLACTVSVSPETVALRLSTQRGRFVWSTQSCPAAMPTATIVARRDVAGSINLAWSGHYADSTCSAAAAWAVPGWYHAVASWLGGSETDVQFQLGPAVAATITKTASPTAGPTASGAATGRPVATPGSTPTGRPAGSPSGAVEPTG